MKQIFTILAAAAISQAAYAQVGVVNVKGNLDTWRNYNAITPMPPSSHALEVPEGWFSSDSLIFAYGPMLSPTHTFVQQLTKDAASHAGAFAAKLTTVDQGPEFGAVPSILANAKMDIDPATFDPADPLGSLEFEGGTPVTERINTVSVWVKYTPASADKALIRVELLKGTSVVADKNEFISATPTWTKITVLPSYANLTDVPTILRVMMVSSDPDNPQVGSVLLVDDVEAIGASGVATKVFNAPTVQLYPVPAKGSINLSTTQSQPLVWQAYTIDGKAAAQKMFSKATTVDIAHLAAGVYTYTVSDLKGEVLQRSKFTIQ